MFLSQWGMLSADEKKTILINVVTRHRHLNWFDGFEIYVLKSIDLVDAFIELAAQFRQSHNRFGGKAIFEILRYRTYHKDSSGSFKVNNNYSCDVTRLVGLLFPEEFTGFFEVRKQKVAA